MYYDSKDIREASKKEKGKGKASGEEERSITSCSNSMNHDQSTRRHSTCRTTRLTVVSTSFGDKNTTQTKNIFPSLLMQSHPKSISNIS